ncbi:hypothetical protein ADIS_0862 [Lunatimonas lonarensis]|uniref:Uncharacterized protein n=1 Tax=Lunatimonas lonarensis TaxID=1232681 RepID=R7ZXF2_9BACT|nr:hypothetical protein [Lunatimonas lonarensis]EON78688.1 hypothetical protein ADIS_0862 [Lunatimonas lonarensis]
MLLASSQGVPSDVFPPGRANGDPSERLVKPRSVGDFLHADTERFGLNPPISVAFSQEAGLVHLYTFPGFYGESVGEVEMNIPMDPEDFTGTIFRVFMYGSQGWFAAPGRSLCGRDFWRVFSSYAAGWARVFLLPREDRLRCSPITKIRVLAISGSADADPISSIDFRNYLQVVEYYGFVGK